MLTTYRTHQVWCTSFVEFCCDIVQGDFTQILQGYIIGTGAFLHAKAVNTWWWEINIHSCYSLVKIAFVPICTGKNNRRIWHHNARTPRSRDVTDQLWWHHNANWIGLDWICLTTTHVLQDILAVLHKWMSQNYFYYLNNYSSPIILSILGASWS